ncbi:MAG: hypothetical protein HY951_18650 [Bacteroidia bacterium]|nr:hypothetical protein [Bacteroidia bacterium]
MKVLLLILLFVILNSTELNPFMQVSANADIVLNDALGNIYTVKENNLILYSSEGKKLYSYSNSFLGNISMVDVTDPMRILLFFKEFNKVIFLSNKLSEIGSPIELDNSGYSQVNICCTSNSGGFWIFDSQMLQLIHLNGNLEADRKGTIIQSVFNKSENIPVKLLENNDIIYMSVPKTGLLLFDKFGVYKKLIPITEINYFQIIGDNIIYLSENKLCSYSLIKNELIQEINLDLKIKSVSVFKDKMIALNDNEILFFNINN